MKFKTLNEADSKKRHRINDNPIVKKIMADREKAGAPSTDKEVKADWKEREWTNAGNPDDLYSHVYDALINSNDPDIIPPKDYGIRRFDYNEVADMSDKYGKNAISVYVNDEDDVKLVTRVAEDNNLEVKQDPSNDKYYKAILTLIIPEEEVVTEDLDEFDYDGFEHKLYQAILSVAKEYKYVGISRDDVNKALNTCSVRIEDDEDALFLESLTEASATAEKPKTKSVGSIIRKHLDEISSINNVQQMKQKVIEIVNSDDSIDKNEKDTFVRNLLRQKSPNAILSMLGTYISSIKKIESLNESEKVNNKKLEESFKHDDVMKWFE